MIKPYKVTRCGNCGNEYRAGSTQLVKCPHPTVQAVKGKYICYICCIKCKHHKEIKGSRLKACFYKEDIKEENKC